MKRILLMTMLMLATVVISAREQHLTFKGIPIDGTLDQFVVKMKAAGFIHDGTHGGDAHFKGDFAGYKNCEIIVRTLRPKNIVYVIVVEFPLFGSIKETDKNYIQLKEMLVTKYGKFVEQGENFVTYEIPEGKINLRKVYGIFDTGNITLTYSDNLNTAKIKADALDDL